MFEYRSKTALVSGASSGIGKAFAEALAARGMSVVLVARSVEVLNALAAELSAKHKVLVDVVPADLSKPDSIAQVSNAVAALGRTVDLLVNNAGVMTYGPFETIDPARESEMVHINCTALVALTHSFLPGMLARRSGGVINVASTASFQPTPYLATYAATKAFVSSFSVALTEECASRGVRVTAICPGMTKTQIFNDNDMPVASMGPLRTPEQVVATALAGFDSKRTILVDGWKNFLVSLTPRLGSSRLSARIAALLVGPKQKPQ